MGSLMSNLSASELLEEALLHIGEPYFHQLTQDVEILVDVINHGPTQRFIREKLVRNHEELIEQCHEIEDAKCLCDLLRGLKILIDGLSWTSGMAIEQGCQFLFSGLCEDLKFLRNSVNLNVRVGQFIDYLQTHAFKTRCARVVSDSALERYIQERTEHMKLVYGIRNEEGESVDMIQERINRALEAESEAIAEEHRQIMAENYMERNCLVDELYTLFEPIWIAMIVLLKSGPEYSNKSRDHERSPDECSEVVEGVRPSSCPKKQESLDWLDRSKKKLIGYLYEDRSAESDDEMRHFVEESNLDNFKTLFIGRIIPWLVQIKKKIDNLPRKSLCLRKELIMKEVERLSKFYYARMLNKPDLLRDHEKILTELMHQAANQPRIRPITPDSWMSMMPLISFEQFSWNPNTNTQNVCMMFVLNSSYTVTENDAIKTKLGILFNVRSAEIVHENGVKVVKFTKTIDGNVRKYVYCHIHELANLQIPAAFIGDYGLEVQRAMNPHYFRIYSIRGVDQADGFIPTSFIGFEDRGGEPYFCPNGWRRFSVDVGEMSDAMYANWPVAYHGTKKELAQKILMASIKASGNCMNLPKGGGGIFLSPSIEYSGHPRYAGVWRTDRWWRENKYIQLVLQVRVKKSRIFNKIEGTLHGARSFDPPFDPNFAHNREMEWIIKWPPGKLMNAKDGLLVYGVMLRVTDVHPSKLPQNQWWQRIDYTDLSE